LSQDKFSGKKPKSRKGIGIREKYNVVEKNQLKIENFNLKKIKHS
jgi:hypothetical protein